MAAKDQKLFLEACKKKFKEEPTQMETKYYCYGGWKQSKRKVELQATAAEIAKKRGFPMMNEDIGVPLGQRSWMPYQLSHTDIFVEPDDLHCINNPAIQQAWDDIRRTVLVGLDSPHQTIEKRLGKEVTPETISNYLEVVNHTMPGGAVVQEHMAECNPALVADSYVKVFSGNDDLIDEIDPRFVIDINKNFPKEQAAQLKKAIGNTLMQAVRVPTMVGRLMDGGTVSRHAAMQISMAFISAYKLAAGEAAIADFAYSAKHQSITMGTMMPARRVRGPNEPGGITFGFLDDMVQSDRVYPDDPGRAALESDSPSTLLQHTPTTSLRTTSTTESTPSKTATADSAVSSPTTTRNSSSSPTRSPPTHLRCTRGTPPLWRPTSEDPRGQPLPPHPPVSSPLWQPELLTTV